MDKSICDAFLIKGKWKVTSIWRIYVLENNPNDKRSEKFFCLNRESIKNITTLNVERNNFCYGKYIHEIVFIIFKRKLL